jgi:hypothetical protein
MYFDLNKKDKKIAREAIDKSLEAKYKEGIEKAEVIIKDWRSGRLVNTDAYLKLYKTLKKHDDEIARRYDRLGGSRYLFTVAMVLYDGYITEEDVKDLSEEAKETMNSWIAFWKSKE